MGATLANSNQPERSIEAYSSAITILPSYVRARYNLSLSLVNLGKYEDAADSLITALDIQQNHVSRFETIGDDYGNFESLSSDSVWSMLGSVLSGHLQRYELIPYVRKRNLKEIKKKFSKETR